MSFHGLATRGYMYVRARTCPYQSRPSRHDGPPSENCWTSNRLVSPLSNPPLAPHPSLSADTPGKNIVEYCCEMLAHLLRIERFRYSLSFGGSRKPEKYDFSGIVMGDD